MAGRLPTCRRLERGWPSSSGLRISLALGLRPLGLRICCFEHADETFGSRPRPPGIPPARRARRSVVMQEPRGVFGRRAWSRCWPGWPRSNVAEASVMVCTRVRAPRSLDGGCRRCSRSRRRPTRSWSWLTHLVELGVEPVADGVDVGLLSASFPLPAGGQRGAGVAGQRRRGQERAQPSEDRQAGRRYGWPSWTRRGMFEPFLVGMLRPSFGAADGDPSCCRDCAGLRADLAVERSPRMRNDWRSSAS